MQRQMFSLAQKEIIEERILNFVQQQLKTQLPSTKQLIEFYLDNKSRGMINWHYIDQQLGFSPYKNNKSFSYKYFAETMIPRYSTPWPEELILKIDDETRMLAAKMRVQFSNTQSTLDYVALRKDIMDQVTNNLELRQYNHSYKRVQDRIRNMVDDIVKCKYYQPENTQTEISDSVTAKVDNKMKQSVQLPPNYLKSQQNNIPENVSPYMSASNPQLNTQVNIKQKSVIEQLNKQILQQSNYQNQSVQMQSTKIKIDSFQIPNLNQNSFSKIQVQAQNPSWFAVPQITVNNTIDNLSKNICAPAQEIDDMGLLQNLSIIYSASSRAQQIVQIFQLELLNADKQQIEKITGSMADLLSVALKIDLSQAKTIAAKAINDK
ncbi:Hypothetical_protein [Hexamita inflata]|uniref:Hypothetical_protein n=1 Tax=Hexamita inflata TaxID=28002 RepID=A0AA86PME8_9EUKA|nr:Hypothetical protein HINF_LOCUS30229 [Hexamita inflata]